MATVTELTDRHINTYTYVPPVQQGVCEICHGGPPGQGYTRCYSCFLTMSAVSYPVQLVVPISLYEIPGQLHTVLRGYKDGWPEVRDAFALQVAALLTRFLQGHEACIQDVAGQDWDFITTTPSSKGREGLHPLEGAIQRSPFLRDQYRSVLKRGEGKLDFRKSSDDGYEVTEDVRGESVLLVDDTLTTGARAQSAASALRIAGAWVIGMVPVGRVIGVDWAPELWENARKHGFSFDTCCLESG